MGDNGINKTISYTNIIQLVKDVSKLHSRKKYYDVVLVVGEQRLRVHAHKAILAVRGEFFNELFSRDSQNEVVIDVPVVRFLNLLEYVYTGSIPDCACTVDMLILAHNYVIPDLKDRLIKKVKFNVNMGNVYATLDAANWVDSKTLQDDCHSILENNVEEVISSGHLKFLSQKSLINLLSRDTFAAPELEIFKTVIKWLEVNKATENLVERCVRLSLMSVVDLLSIVWPSNLVKSEDLIEAIRVVCGFEGKKSRPRARILVDQNIAHPDYKARVTSGVNGSVLLSGNRTVTDYAKAEVDLWNGFVINLNNLWHFNHIEMMLWDMDTRFYSYYISVSQDNVNWHKIIDFSAFACRSVQYLYFEPQIAQYIHIVGTRNSNNPGFHLIYVEVYFKSSVPKFINGILYPDTNVATYEKKATVLEGMNPGFLLDGRTQTYTQNSGYCVHVIGKGCILLQLAQPYIISSMKLLLWDLDDRNYKYFIETSVNKQDWEMAVDRRNEECKSWQNLYFEERPVVFVRIVGTYCSANNNFHCVHFECPAQEAKQVKCDFN